MTLDRLWAAWRSTYVSGAAANAASGQSVFTQILESGCSDEETHIVWRGVDCFAILNAYPYGSGHLMVMPYREVAALEALTPAGAHRAVGRRS